MPAYCGRYFPKSRLAIAVRGGVRDIVARLGARLGISQSNSPFARPPKTMLMGQKNRFRTYSMVEPIGSPSTTSPLIHSWASFSSSNRLPTWLLVPPSTSPQSTL